MQTAGERWTALAAVVARYRLVLSRVRNDGVIAGSYWGAPEAGIVNRTVFARADTPVHSVLHETAHVVCMSPARRASLHTDAGGSDLEECAVCYLQVVLALELYQHDLTAVCADMDAWGYSFRLGSALAWFEHDAQDARAWLLREGLLDTAGAPVYRLRDAGLRAAS